MFFKLSFSAYVMVPFVQQPPTPNPTVYTYSTPAPAVHHPHHSYQAVKSIEYAIPSTQITPLQTHVDYKNMQTIVPKNSLPSIATTSFRQYYSPGLEYHYTEVVPANKFHPSSYAYHHAPTHNYQTSFVSQPAPYYYHHQNAPSNIYKQSTGLLDSYVPSLVTYARQQQQQHHHQQYPQQYQPQQQFKNYQNYQQNYYSSASMPQQQQLFTPAQQSPSSHYASSYSSPQAYNTIAYSVPLPPYDHSKRSTKATASLSVKAPKSS